MTALFDPSERVQNAAVLCLRKLPLPDKPQAALLMNAAKAKNPLVRSYAFEAWVQLDLEPKEIASAYDRAMQDEHPPIRQEAMTALKKAPAVINRLVLARLLLAFGDADQAIARSAREMVETRRGRQLSRQHAYLM